MTEPNTRPLTVTLQIPEPVQGYCPMDCPALDHFVLSSPPKCIYGKGVVYEGEIWPRPFEGCPWYKPVILEKIK